MTALYRVVDTATGADIGYCKKHYADALARIAKFGNRRIPRRKLKKIPVKVKQVDKPSPRERKRLFQVSLRANPTPEESKLRLLLSQNEETKGRYQFQVNLNGYFPDFVYPKARLIIEVDGWHHTTTAGKRADARRTGHLKAKGYEVLRFMNFQVRQTPNEVMASIIACQRARLDNDVRRNKS